MRKIAAYTALVMFTAQLHAADMTNEDIESLRDWINSKRMVTVKELGGQLSISGDIHAEMQSSNQKTRGVAQRGRLSGSGIPSTSYDVEFNLNLDYRADRTWAAARIRYDEDAGITSDCFGSGKNDKFKMDRAYFGYRIYDGDRHTMDVEAGRRAMYTIWDSRLQFGSNFDGVTFKDYYAFEKAGDFYYSLGIFMINEKKDQAGYGGEIGLLNIARTGFYAKYSIIDWDTKENVKIPEQFYFIVSQAMVGYKFIPTSLNRLVHFYLAGLYNHRAEHIRKFDEKANTNKRANFGGYIGMAVGQTKQAGDWALDLNYQVLAAQCVPEMDTLGIGMGSPSSNSFYWTKDKDCVANVKNKNFEGNVNYRGFAINLQYLLTNNLNIFQEWKQSITLDDGIGPFRQFKQYEIDFIYSF